MPKLDTLDFMTLFVFVITREINAKKNHVTKITFQVF